MADRSSGRRPTISRRLARGDRSTCAPSATPSAQTPPGSAVLLSERPHQPGLRRAASSVRADGAIWLAAVWTRRKGDRKCFITLLQLVRSRGFQREWRFDPNFPRIRLFSWSLFLKLDCLKADLCWFLDFRQLGESKRGGCDVSDG